MPRHLMIPAALGALLLSASPVPAANNVAMPSAGPAETLALQTDLSPLAERCAALGRQFDARLKGLPRTPTVGAAMWKRAEAGVDCQNGKPGEGVAKLEKALEALPARTRS